MPQRLFTFSNKGYIEFGSGNFDDWCVFVTKPNGEKFAPSDEKCFKRLKSLGEKFGFQNVYDDFVVVFNRTTSEIDNEIFKLISYLSQFYKEDHQVMEIWLSVLYAAMVAEENKENAILKKRIKRLGLHQVLLEDWAPRDAAKYSKGVSWKKLDEKMNERGF